MSTTTALLLDLRTKLQDLGEVSYSDYELLRKIEEGDREIRRLAAVYKPSYLAEPYEGICDPGERLVALPSHTLLLEIVLDGKALDPIGMDEYVARIEEPSGKPKAFMSFGKVAFRWLPVPDLAYTFTAWYVPTAAPLVKDQELPWPTEFDDLLLDYAVTRIQGGGEAAQFFAQWHDEVVQLLSGIAPKETLVEGYFR